MIRHRASVGSHVRHFRACDSGGVVELEKRVEVDTSDLLAPSRLRVGVELTAVNPTTLSQRVPSVSTLGCCVDAGGKGLGRDGGLEGGDTDGGRSDGRGVAP